MIIDTTTLEFVDVDDIKKTYMEEDTPVMSELLRTYRGLSVDDVNELLAWSGDSEYVSVSDIIDVKKCAYCGKELNRDNMEFTRDCYGIPYRLVCFDCWDELMENGYDGQRYYDGIDEYVDYY